MRLAIFTLLATTLITAVSHAASTAEVQTGSNGRVMWEYNCDYFGNDYRSLIGISEICGDTCADDVTCTHWTWSAFNGGTCWLKQGMYSKTTSNGTTCGYVISRSEEVTALTSGLSIADMADMLGQINAFRSQEGRDAVSIDYRLVKAASLYSQNQASYCNKNLMTDADFTSMVEAQGYDGLTTVTEAAGQTTVADVMTWWRNSTTHSAIILNQYVVNAGFALAKSDSCNNSKTYWTVILGRPN